MAKSPSVKSAKFKSPLVLLLIAALMAGAVSWVAYYYLQQREAAMKEEIAAKGKLNNVVKVRVAVPIADSPVGTVLNQTNFVARPIDEDLVYPDTVLADDFAAMEGATLALPVLRGRPLRLSDLVAPEVSDVAAILPAGKRALTIEIDNVNSIAQTLRPNHHVDLFLLSKAVKREGAPDQGEGSLEQASLYMQDVVVLATGTEFHDVSKGDDAAATRMVRPGDVPGKEKTFDTVTLLVTPKEAARLMIGQKMGSYRVALRGTTDRAPVALATLRAGDLLPSNVPARNRGIEFIVGGGNDKLVTEMAVPPSQQIVRAVMAARVGSNEPFPKEAAAPTPEALATAALAAGPSRRTSGSSTARN